MEKTLSIAICDDEPIWIEEERELIEAYCRQEKINVSVAEYHSGKEMLSAYRSGELPDIDLLLLDIEMPEISGLEVRDKLAFINNVRRIIFMTSHVEAMEDAFGLKVMRFLTKPVDKDEFFKALHRVEEELALDVTVSYENGSTRKSFKSQELCYIEVRKDNSILYFMDRDRECEEVRKKLSYWPEVLPERSFVQVHRSFIINMDHILNADYSTVSLEGYADTPIAIGRKYRKDFKEKYENYLFETMERRI